MPEKGDWRWEFDTTGGTQKITQSKENVNNYAPSGKTAPDYHGAIGVTDDSVEGCENRRAAVQVDRNASTRRQRGDLGLQPDALRPDGQDQRRRLPRLFGRPGALPRRQGLAVGQESGPGRDYLQLRRLAGRHAIYRSATSAASPRRLGNTSGSATARCEDTDAKKLVKRPTSVHVERVYDSGDFSELGIGSSTIRRGKQVRQGPLRASAASCRPTSGTPCSTPSSMSRACAKAAEPSIGAHHVAGLRQAGREHHRQRPGPLRRRRHRQRSLHARR